MNSTWENEQKEKTMLLWFMSPRFHPSLAIHFGDFKDLPTRGTRLNDEKLYFRTSQKDEMQTLHMSCLKDLSKLLFMGSPATEEKKTEGRKKDKNFEACEAISDIRAEVDGISQKVSALQASVKSGTKVDEREFILSTELLMMQLLKLDSIEAEGEAKAQRKNEVRRIQGYVDTLDTLKEKNSNG